LDRTHRRNAQDPLIGKKEENETQLFFLFLTGRLAIGESSVMPRRPRIAPGGLVYHMLNRAVARLALFEKEADYAAFERVLGEALQQHPTRLLSYAVMPNHWHLVLWPREDGELTEFVLLLTRRVSICCTNPMR
jgi:hypothetical protein